VFLKFIQSKKPYVIMKTAMTLDGKIDSRTGDSRWVTNEQSRARVHELRNELMAIMIGVDTVIADDPILTTRLNGNRKGRNPIRIVLDSQARIPLDSKILNTSSEAQTIVAVTSSADQEKLKQIEALGNECVVVGEKNGRVDLNLLMSILGEKAIDGILLEGGASLNFSALESQIIDEVHAYIAPKIIGGQSAKTPVGGEGIEKMNDAVNLQNVRYENIAGDILVIGEVVY
jgi:diaminohydroxyphosphoribosylaminopyrimidine deaminase/5-amino-6-(5-phosphoribosylamino)uracil reductase